MAGFGTILTLDVLRPERHRKSPIWIGKIGRSEHLSEPVLRVSVSLSLTYRAPGPRRSAGVEITRTLPVSQQCRLLAVSRSSVYRRPPEVGEEDRTITALIDRHYLARPYCGSRRMVVWLATQGHLVNRKRVQRLTRLVAIYQRSNR